MTPLLETVNSGSPNAWLSNVLKLIKDVMMTAEGISGPLLNSDRIMTEEMKGTLVALTLIIEIYTLVQQEAPLHIVVQLHLLPFAIDPLTPWELRHQRTMIPESYLVVL